MSIVATDLATTGASVNVSASSPPSAGDILVATSPTVGQWSNALDPQTLYQNRLGFGQTYTLAMFGWAGGSADIYDAFRDAIAAAHAAGGGTVLLPAGALSCSLGVVVQTCWSTNSGIMIRGQGDFVTQLTFTTDVAIGIHFDGGASPSFNYILGGGCEGFTLNGFGGFQGTATGCGIKYSASIACSTRDVSVGGFGGLGGVGIWWADVGSQNCEIQSISNIGVYFCKTGMVMGSVAEFVATQCRWHGCDVGCHIIAATGAFVGGLIQSGGIGSPATAGLVLDTGVSSISLHGTIYVEGAWSQAVIKADGAGTNIALDLNASFDCATGTGTLLDVATCNLRCSGVWRTSSLTTFIKARSMLSCLISGQSAGPSVYDFDAVSAATTTWISPRGVSIGTPAPVTASDPPLLVRSYAYDGSYWTTQPSNNFVQLCSGIFGELLREVFHAGMGINLNASTATQAMDSWTGQVRGLVLPVVSGGNGPIYCSDGSNFRGRPVPVTDQATARAFRLTGLGPGIFLSGEVPCVLGCARYTTDITELALFGTGVAGVSDGLYSETDSTHFMGHIMGTTVTGPAFDTVQHHWKFSSNGASVSTMTIDGTDYTTASGAALGVDQTTLGIGTVGSGGYHIGSVAHGCWVFLRAAPSAQQWAAFRALMTREFG
jgi:hypothetical protein